MYDQQQQRINRAAQEFTEALVAAYKTTSESTAVAQELGARQIEYFFDAVIGNLRAQAGGTSQMARQLAGQQRLAQETTRDLARVSTDNYMDLLDSVFSFYQGGASRTQRRADEARGHIEEAKARAEQAEARAGEAERARSEAESRGGDEEGDTEADAASQPQSQWVRTSGRSKVRGRDTRARNRSSGRSR
jgi:uncharacterized protein YdaU (DUF1376 family)